MRSVRGAILTLFLTIALRASPAQPPTASQPVGNLPPLGTPEELLQYADVQKELKLSSQQLETINRVLRTLTENHRPDFDKIQSLSPPERRQKQADLVKTISDELRRALSPVLEPIQAKRLEQINLQRQGLLAFTSAKVEKALRPTGEQRTQLKTIRDDAVKEARTLFRDSAPGRFEETLKKVEQLRGKALEKSVAVLTPEQKKVWRELIGEPFTGNAASPLIRPH